MENAKKPVYLVKSNDMMFAEKAVFSSAELAAHFIEVQQVRGARVDVLKDLTLHGLVPLQSVQLYLKEEPDLGFEIEGVIEKVRAPEYSSTVWFDPLVNENARGLGLYHSRIKKGHLDEPCLSFGCAGCTCQITEKEAPMLRKDSDEEGVFHCFARNQEDATRTAHTMMKKHWAQLPLHRIAGWNGWLSQNNDSSTTESHISPL
ncbi:MAG: hypothetical protein IPI72_03970 [Flavobacteriales bacterium]|nr:hypothetical protein [Flavobacteriales bacterium]